MYLLLFQQEFNIQLVYDVNTESFDADYGYEAYSETSDKSPAEVFEEWIIQIKNEV